MVFEKLLLYFNTIKYLKPSQILYRIWRPMRRLQIREHLRSNKGIVPPFEHLKSFVLPELDFDPEYLKRFNVEEMMDDTFTFLNDKHKLDLTQCWNDPELTHLWRFNLHYFEYLYPLGYAYSVHGEDRYYNKYRELILRWIAYNPYPKGDGWHPYTISLRLINWVCSLELFYGRIEKDGSFKKMLIHSIYRQYLYLQKNVEKELLGNHYFENIRALILCSIFFADHDKLTLYKQALFKQLEEQILNDGMHFELSPMYHKIVLEGLLKIHYWSPCTALNGYIQKMVNAAYSLEKNMGKTPFFNDSAENIAKSMASLIAVANRYFHIAPEYRMQFEKSGYYMLETPSSKCVIDAGPIGPDYLPGHGHCDALSYELSVKGHPFIVNSGTYEYQNGKWRSFFRSTRAHNTLLIDENEQSGCWSSFRVAGRISGVEGQLMQMTQMQCFKGSYFNYRNQQHLRCMIWVEDNILVVLDRIKTKSNILTSSGRISVKNYIHLHPDYVLVKDKYWEAVKDRERIPFAQIIGINSTGERLSCGDDQNGWYAPEFGIKLKNSVLEISSTDCTDEYENNVLYTGYIIDLGCHNITAAWTHGDPTVVYNRNLLTLKYGSVVRQIDINFLDCRERR